MDYVCKACGARLGGVPIEDGRQGLAFVDRSQYGPPIGCSNSDCVNWPRGATWGWAQKV